MSVYDLLTVGSKPWCEIKCHGLEAEGDVSCATFNHGAVPVAVSFGAVGNTPNANAGVLTAGVIHLQPANSSFGGLISTGAQNIPGAKSFDAATTTMVGLRLNDPAVLPSSLLRVDGSNKVTSGTVNLASGDVSGVLPVSGGGTGLSSLVNPFRSITTDATATAYLESGRFRLLNDNLFVGGDTGNETLTGSRNLAVGSGIFNLAGKSLTSGIGNTLLQGGAGVTSGNNNCFIGEDVGNGVTTASECIGMGVFTLANHATGNGAIAIGGGSLFSDTNATNIIAIGRFSCGSAVSCNDSVFIGTNASTVSNSTFTNVCAIGNLALAGANNVFIAGSGQCVGIGKDNADQTAYALDLGTDHGMLPRVRMASSAVASAPSAGEGVLQVSTGKLTYVSGNANLSGAVGTYRSGGADDTSGQAVLNGVVGVVVATTAVQLTSIVQLTSTTLAGLPAGTEGFLIAGSIIPSVSFTIYSSNAADVATANWQIVNA